MRTLFTLIIAVLFTANIGAQTPQRMSYQAVIRNAANNLVANQSVGMRVSILRGSATGTEVYKEIYNPNPQTNANGLITIEIGSGSPVAGTYASIDWANGPYFIKTEADPAGGTNYTITGTSQLLSVPYALLAKVAESISGSGSGWQITGNAGTSSSTNFIGTTDNTPLKFRTNNTMAGVLDPTLDNTGFGKQALNAITSGINNTAIGALAMSNISTGWGNVAVGYKSAYKNTVGLSNVSVGAHALENSITGNDNIAIGDSSLYNNGIGSANAPDASKNIAFGSKALFSNTIGSNNIANGYQALFFNTTGSGNIAIGKRALQGTRTSSFNVAIGNDALSSGNYGDYNIAIGTQSLWHGGGSHNVAIGYNACTFSMGSSNTCIGDWAGENRSFEQSTLIGCGAEISNEHLIFNNCIALGYNAMATGPNTAVIGNTSLSSIGGYVGWTTYPSDRRYKKNILDNVPGLEFINQLRPITYTLDINSLNADLSKDDLKTLSKGALPRIKTAMEIAGIAAKEKIVYTGFIAQDVEEAAQKIGYDFIGVDAPKDADGLYGIRYAEFVVPLVKGMQEQQAMIEELTKKIDQLQLRIEQLEAK